MTDYKLKAFERFTDNDPASDYAADFCTGYDGTENKYFCDAIIEFADINTSIHYSDIFEYIRNNPDSINNAINEFGWDGCGKNIYKAAQTAEFMNIENELYRDFEEIKKTITANLIEADEDGDDDETAQAWRKLTDGQKGLLLDQFESDVDNIDSGERLWKINDAFNDYKESIIDAANVDEENKQ